MGCATGCNFAPAKGDYMKAFPYRARVLVKRANGEILADYVRTYRGNRIVAANRMTRAAFKNYPLARYVRVEALS
jgi:hypothetical protein